MADKKFVVKNGLTTQNISFVDDIGTPTNTITVSMLGTDTLSFSGDSGQLFSITDSQTGTIFAVNDISGVPSIEVDDDGTIRLAETFGNVLVGTATDDGVNKLQVNGNIALNGAISADGSIGTSGQVLTSDGIKTYWSTSVGFTGSQGDTGFTGSQGELGYTGSQGAAGGEGSIGYTGSQGDTGFTGSIGFTGSRGDIGFTGSQGDTGFTGSVGFTGSQGDTGFTGSIGFTGSRGDTGVITETSDTAPVSPIDGQLWFDTTDSTLNVYYDDGNSQQWVTTSGPQGNIGFTGSQGVGFTGSQGDTGFTGSVGFTGSSGDTGLTGSSGDTGFTGSQGDTGFTGSQGIGFTGSQGDTGFTGSRGAYDAIGFTGSQGDTGFTGSQGALQGWTIVTANYNLQNGDRIIANTSGGGFSITLPASPPTGFYAQITDGDNFATNNLTILTNGSTIEDVLTDVLLDISDTTFEFIYDGSTWQVTSTAGPKGETGFTGSIGFTGSSGPTNIPENSQTSAYTLQSSDIGKYINITTGGITVPSGVFSTGDIVTIFNNSGSTQTLTQGTSTTLRLAGTTSTGNRTISQYGLVSVICVGSETFAVSGAGII